MLGETQWRRSGKIKVLTNEESKRGPGSSFWRLYIDNKKYYHLWSKIEKRAQKIWDQDKWIQRGASQKDMRSS